MKIKNAIIESAIIHCDDGPLTAWLQLQYNDVCHQRFGGYSLYLPSGYKHHNLRSCAGHFIFRVLAIAGACEWAKLPGKAIRVRIEDGDVRAIGHIINDDWFCPAEDFAPKEHCNGAS